MDIYIVLTEDRHADADARPFTTKEGAVKAAESEVASLIRHPDDLDEDARELNDAMARDGWVWYCRYGVEGDSVRVLRRELKA